MSCACIFPGSYPLLSGSLHAIGYLSGHRQSHSREVSGCCCFPPEAREVFCTWVIVSKTFVPVSLCMLDYFTGMEARGNNMRTNVGNISSDIPKWHMNTSISRLRANLEGDKTSSIIVKETLVLPKAMLYLINILKQYLYSITLSLFLTFLVFLESGARNNFLALKVKSWIFKVVNPICVWLRGLWRYLI